MAQPATYHRYTYREYLALEQSANVKHEYFNGEIYAPWPGARRSTRP